ncbi:hypothetical protein KEM48_007107 [Puccinia striiformis f. sp. tritici PST-130]|nr:hypothetical protein KEM48_007107 [Puccinia striiformis f. sp. tritici PST-130]
MPRSTLHTSCLALYVTAAIHVATRPTICYGAGLAKRAIERETDRILPCICSCPNQSEAAPSRKRVRLFGVDLSDERNTRLKEAPVGREKDDPQSSSLPLKAEDTLGTISLEAYAALVPELFGCQFGSLGTIPELLECLRNPSASNVEDTLWIQRIDNTKFWLFSKGIGAKNRINLWNWEPKIYNRVESRFEAIKAREVLKTISLERYLELAPVVLGYPQHWHKEFKHFLMKNISLLEWAEERGNKLALWTIKFFKTHEINLKNYNVKSGSHEHLVQNLLKDLMRVFEQKKHISKDRAEPSREQVRSLIP